MFGKKQKEIERLKEENKLLRKCLTRMELGYRINDIQFLKAGFLTDLGLSGIVGKDK